jgi:hypothetical protein
MAANISTDFSTWSSTASSNQPDSTDSADIQSDLRAIQAAVKGAVGVTLQAYDADTAKLDVEQTWTAQQTPKNGTLTAGASIAWDCDTNGQSVSVTLDQNSTMAAPSNVNAHCCYIVRITQGASAYTVTWNAAYKFAYGTDPVMSTGSGAVDIYTFVGGAGNVMYCVGQAKALA